MALNPQHVLALAPIVTRQNFTVRDTILYALGVGARALQFVFEERLTALPTMAVVLGYPGFIWRRPEFGVDWRRVLHGEQALVVHRPLPIEGEIIGTTRIDALFDKGKDKGTIARVCREVHDAAGNHLATVTSMTVLRGDGGHGGSSTAPPVPQAIPDSRPPDYVLTGSTWEDQALLYRLSGDLNPLHVDPEVARAAGFERPILHGLATYGVAGRILLEQLGRNDPAALRRLDVRFTSPMYPGESLRIDAWMLQEGRYAFRASCPERSVVVLNNGYAEFAA